MPVQKGKRRNRGRRRVTGDGQSAASIPATTSVTPARKISPAPRRRPFEFPLWANIAMGVFIIVAGVTLFAPWTGHKNLQERLIFLVLYALMAAFYFGRALRQYRSR